MALRAASKRPQTSEAEQYEDGPPEGTRIGIALSGGGIRSAAFNLGALQALQEKDVLARSSYLAAVSGGNYIGAALTISSAYSTEDDEDGKPRWSAGSPEERYLRNNTDYIAPGWTGRLWLALSTTYGFLLNYLPFLLTMFLVGRVLGWTLHLGGLTLDELQFTGVGLPSSWALRALLILLGTCVAIALLLVCIRRFHDGYLSVGDYGESKSERLAAWVIGAALIIIATLALPALAAGYAAASTWLLVTVLRDQPDAFDSVVGRLEVGAIWLVLALVVAGAALLLSRRLRARRLMMGLSSISGAALLLIPLLSSLEQATRTGIRDVDVAAAVGALLVVLLMGVFVHNRRYSLHLFYRERLNSAFALRRTRTRTGRVLAEPMPYDKKLSFSRVGEKLSGMSLPKLIVCCAVNITTDVVPSGRFAESFTFTHDRSGSPLFGYHPTTQFETRRGPAGTELTLPSLMAVSGAALSPLMGRFTYPPMRFLMALTNVRLGVWVPSPLSRHWEDETEPDRTTWWRRVRRTVIDGWREPGAYYVLREALGVLRPDSRFMYLSDGGHWENLGLVELLRRTCTHVLCFDASSDTASAGQDIGRAIAIARSDLGVEVELDPRPTFPGGNGLADDVVARGIIRYPDGSEEAKLVYAKAVLTEGTSWDLHAFRRRSPLFPNHPTSQQMFTDEQFEAYRALGYAAGRRAVDVLNLAPIVGRTARTSNGSGPRPRPSDDGQEREPAATP